MDTRDLLKRVDTNSREEVLDVLKSLYRQGRTDDAIILTKNLPELREGSHLKLQLERLLNWKGVMFEMAHYVSLNIVTAFGGVVQCRGSMEDLDKIGHFLDDQRAARYNELAFNSRLFDNCYVVGSNWWAKYDGFMWKFHRKPEKKNDVYPLTIMNVFSGFNGFNERPLKECNGVYVPDKNR